jgi:hypothetical protein
MQEDYPRENTHNKHFKLDLRHSNCSDGEDNNILDKPELPVCWSKGVLHKTIVSVPKERS